MPAPTAAVQEPLALAYDANHDRPHAPEPLPESLSPRRRLTERGAGALSDAELLAVVIGGDERRALSAATHVLTETGGFEGLLRSTAADMRGLGSSGVTPIRAAALLAAAEIGARVHAPNAEAPPPLVSSPEDVAALLGARFAGLRQEHFVVVLLDTKNRVISAPTVTVGTLNSSLVHPREVFRPAVKAAAAHVILAHNHPSGDPAPSAEDRAITRRLVEAGELFGIEVLDHVVFGGFAGRHVSLKERGLMR